MSDSNILKYISYHTLINPSFWYKLTQVKLDIDRLNENRKHIWGWFTNVKQQHKFPFLEVDCTSFNSNFDERKNYLPVHGFILNKNTVEQFKEYNKLELIDEEGNIIFENIKNGLVLEDPSLLNTFFILSFADIKKFHYYFWFAFPTPGMNVCETESAQYVTNCFTKQQVNNLIKSYKEITDVKQKSFFVIKFESEDQVKIFTLKSFVDLNLNADLNYDDFYFAYSDSSTYELYPGWPLRNYILFLLYYCPKLQNKIVNVISMRLESKKQELTCDNSVIFHIKFPEINESLEKMLSVQKDKEQSVWVGWQKNDRGKFGPRLVDMSSVMDPIRLAENSVDLNLKLMKWRLLPEIDLEKLKDTKFLLLGSGTLGCSVARNLLAWGARNISLVDNGKVSYSNPVRQTLFNHEDCLNGGKMKATAAADNLKKIFPSVCSEGYAFSIPMPGHSVGESLLDETKKSVSLLTELIKIHDVIFLLMDSRESRWLPTVLGAYFKKIVINAALGFDTYLVMRHGFNTSENIETKNDVENIKFLSGKELGCYFCNDITAPGNSLKDRTLDQQCTVTRPGVSPIAGALAVELAVSVLQHKDGPLAQAFYNISNDNADRDMPNEGFLGIIPHSIRGFLSNFTHVLPATRRFEKCIACSNVILEEYEKNGFEFLLNVFNSSKVLEDYTGLTELHQITDTEAMWDILSDSEEDE